MNILVTGSNGQLGNEMRLLAPSNTQHTFYFTDIDELDITNKTAVLEYAQERCVEMIVNCAAYTAVDRAETDEPMARLINALAVLNLGEVATEIGAKIVHISTDYVFDGKAFLPYKETDTPNPVSAYGRTKLEGEQLLQQACAQSVIIRTAWLYSEFGNNFVKTMIRLGNERDKLNVVFDQVGNPTYAADLAAAIMTIVNAETFVSGVYHFGNEGVCSWYDFTKAIHQLAGVECDVQPIRSEQYPTPTERPHYSVFDKSKIKETYGVSVPHWYEALARCINKLQTK